MTGGFETSFISQPLYLVCVTAERNPSEDPLAVLRATCPFQLPASAMTQERAVGEQTISPCRPGARFVQGISPAWSLVRVSPDATRIRVLALGFAWAPVSLKVLT